uniref:non-specific serine/threonine protein kinase n=1 Tax=Elaeis guineensis var. tenera TaxID=51953 RepID=A0A6I9QHY7_ELAGV|nr:receptor kinase-like protein Xa21 [Elaeis guineensis]
MENLQMLNLAYNRIGGSIPQQLDGLRSLSELHLDGNMFLGSIPDSIGNMTQLQSVALSNNLLSSTIPSSIWHLSDVLVLDLSHNSLDSFLPTDVGSLHAIVELNLSTNRFIGKLPEALGSLLTLENLDISHNSFQGPIPQSLGQLISIQSLNLSSNSFSGAIPKSLANLTLLHNLNLSFNRLEGQVPEGGVFSNLTIQSLMGNAALCGATLLGMSACFHDDGGVSHSRSTRRLLIYSLPVIASTMLLAACFYLLITKLNRRRKKTAVPADTVHVPDHRLISYHELSRATDNFSEANLLGTGSFGSVFKGQLDDGSLVAIKVLNLQTEGATESFHTECRALRMARHRNLVKILSATSNLDFKALVLQYMPNGSLERWLYSYNYCLSLIERINIMLDVAMALEYLHHHHLEVVLHCDLKPSNVLLDEDMVAHVSDFGIAKLLHGISRSIASATAPGTIGYMAPEYGLNGTASRRSDVYSYGILLLEAFTRKKPTDAMFCGELSLRQWVNQAFPSAVLNVVDGNLLRDEAGCSASNAFSNEGLMEDLSRRHTCVSSILELGLLCSKELPKERILMEDVVVRLKKIKEQYLSNSYGD